MARYLLVRLLQSLAVLLVVSIVVFALVHLLPGSPAKAMLGLKPSQATIAAFNRLNGYDRPLWVQYWLYIDHVFHGNLGYSYPENATVASLIATRLPKSALLVALSLAVTLILAIPLGLYQAWRRNKPSDYVLTGAAFILYSFPVFWLAFLLIAAFAVELHLLPPLAPSGDSVVEILKDWPGLVLPVATLSLGYVAAYSRYMRSSAVEALVQDYITTARSKGLSERQILFGHVLRNSLIPMTTLIGLSLPSLLGGAVVTEQIFNYPGLGLLFFQAATKEDYAVLLGLTLMGAAGVIVGNLVADVLYGVLDPRIRLT